MIQPQLRLALPQADGSLLLDFEDDGRRYLDADTVSALGLRDTRLFTHAETMTADGLCLPDGSRVAASLLHLASLPAQATHERRNALHLAQLRTTTGVNSSAPRALDVFFYPFERTKALRIDDVIGAGMAADGYSTEVSLDGVNDDALAMRLLRDAGADWLLDALALSVNDSDSERARAVLRAASANGVDGLVYDGPIVTPLDPATLTRAAAAIDDSANAARADAMPVGDTESTSTGEGWWAPPGGSEHWFETSNLDYERLAEDITTVALRMQLNREIDGVPDATNLLLLPFGSNYKLRMIWFDPELGEPLGADEYVLVLHVDPDEEPNFDADTFEHLCRDAGQCAAEVEHYAGPQLYFRWEWGGAHWPLG
jgi:hypothetical protein